MDINCNMYVDLVIDWSSMVIIGMVYQGFTQNTCDECGENKFATFEFSRDDNTRNQKVVRIVCQECR